MRISSVLALLALLLPMALPALATAPDLLPTVQPEASVLADHDLVQDPHTGAILLRFSNAVANVGAGPLVVVGHRDAAPKPVDPANDVMPAYQRISRSDGTTYDVPVGELVYHEAHHHFHFLGAARYRLLDDQGQVLREAAKVSFCLADVAVVDDTLPGYSQRPVFNSCAHNPSATDVAMGVSVGWDDIYDLRLQGQAFDVSDLMQGPQRTYTLESTTNPDGLLHETNQASPASARMQVVIGEGVPVGTGSSRPGV